MKNFPEAEKYLKRALDQLEKYGTAFKSMFLSGDIREAYEMLAACKHEWDLHIPPYPASGK